MNIFQTIMQPHIKNIIQEQKEKSWNLTSPMKNILNSQIVLVICAEKKQPKVI